jgi:two-component system, OmpR family, response regulator
MSVGRVLIVDDEPDILEVLTDILGGLGYDISTAIDGAEALAIVRATPPDVVLLDLTMPVMSGRDTLAQLRQNHPDLPVLIMAARLEAGLAHQELRALGALGYISKPFNIAEIERAVAAAIARR